jgi:hypothetical protein
MQRSIFLAKIIGPVLAVVGLALIFNASTYRILAEEFINSYALIYLSGVLALPIGLALVNTHNEWAADWRVVITIVGWLCLIGGTLRILIPQEGEVIGTAIVTQNWWPVLPGIVVLVLGLWLSYGGYWPKPARAKGKGKK